ncbi:MAG: UvrD-helicase domain-containing protein [Moraxella sp.]|uniref:UvrD-helicase domain-containing protein n=1 Tax=Moraxella sp. TaxID=479 RepID=UPI0026DC66AD|nr:UvrD-helicase domain-containing protein [Moraxella sp.]MDO4449856.1 UvrD-helicase domain-containing protein [Moraxella sp.]
MNNKTIIPAIACDLTGGYLIEASAGTGKTWTLTGIILRLLIEKQYQPEQIIATTFTRAAAREMQERIQEKISGFYYYIRWIAQQTSSYKKWFDGSDVDDSLNKIIEEAKNNGVKDCDDEIYKYLIKKSIDEFINHDNIYIFDVVARKCSVLLTSLDKLFVGTLDSLAQKWLKEFSSEIGCQTNTEIISNSEEMIHSLIHDALRKEHIKIAKSKKLYDIIGADVFYDIDSAYKAVNLSLNFYQAPIDEAYVIDDNYLDLIEHELMGIFDKDLSVFEPFYDIDYMSNFGFSKSPSCVKDFGLIKHILDDIRDYKVGFVNHLSQKDINFLDKLIDIKKENAFKKGFDENKSYFYSLPIDRLLSIVDIKNRIKNIGNMYRSYLYHQMSCDIRVKLKQMLEHQGKSTFTFQMVRLIEALKSNKGLVEHIRRQYPVALIDESQDINGLQKILIESIYLSYFNDRRIKNKKSRGFLLFVGDPKQAIYRFRGGDVSNYNSVKNFGKNNNYPPLLNSSLTLNTNRRSNKNLVHALNSWFEGSHEYLGEGICYHQVDAINEAGRLVWSDKNGSMPDYAGNHPLSLIYISSDENGDKKDESYCIASHINSILQDGHKLDGRSIMPSDIAVLSYQKRDLSKIKSFLDEFNIPSITPNDVNIFTTESANDLYALLCAIIHQDRESLGGLLTSNIFGYQIDDLEMLLGDELIAEKLILYIKKCHDYLIRYGIASSIQWALSKNPLSDDSLWELCARCGERYLVDLCQIIEVIVNEYAYKKINDVGLINWFELMMSNKDDSESYHRTVLPSESGVNLMTIHGSKGLEFPIVYILGLNKQSKPQSEEFFYAYSDESFDRRISPYKDSKTELDYYKKKNNQELFEERLRLGYVALTRASEKTYVVAKEISSNQSLNGMVVYQWLEYQDKKTTLTLPKRLSNKMDLILWNDCQDMIFDKYEPVQHLTEEIVYDDWDKIFSHKYFIGASKSSATSLMYKINRETVSDDIIIDDEIEVDIYGIDNDLGVHYQDNDIRPLFEKGKKAGTFLHKLLEVTDLSSCDNISQSIDKMIVSFGAFDGYHSRNGNIDLHQDLVDWIWAISNTPMLSSNISLAQLNNDKSIKEMKFTLRLTENFGIDNLNQTFLNHSDKEIVLTKDDDSAYYKYLNGEIDLVYEYDGKFYIVDYKSNFISQSLSDYHKDNLERVMNEAGYWLQACVYQVALHRLLKLRIDDYVGNEHHYLGGVEFIFLRGVDSQDHALGHINWQIPISLIYALDEVFG